MSAARFHAAPRARRRCRKPVPTRSVPHGLHALHAPQAPQAPQALHALQALAAKALAGILAILCSAFAGASLAQPALTLEQALRLAEDRSRQLAAQDAAVSASREMAVAAGQRPDPTLRFGINNLPIDTQDRFSLSRDFMTMRSLGVVQEITRSDKLAARAARFEREAEAAAAARALGLSSLRRDTAVAWLDRWFLERMLELLQAQRAEAGLQVEAADAVYRGGRGAQADVFAARSAAAALDDRLRQAELQIATAKTRLARWVGDDEAGQALAPPPPLAAVPMEATRLGTDLAHHPEIAILLEQEAVARAEADIARSNQRADWSVEVMFSQRGPAYSNMVSINVSIPLQLDRRHRQDRELGAKLALAAQVRAMREEAAREHLADTRSWLQEWRSGRERLVHYDSTLIPLAAERARAALAAYRGGAGPLGAVLEARRGEIDTKLDRLRLEMETAQRWARLEYLLAPAHGALAARPAATTPSASAAASASATAKE